MPSDVPWNIGPGATPAGCGIRLRAYAHRPMPPPAAPPNVGRVKRPVVTWLSAIAYAVVLAVALGGFRSVALVTLAFVPAVGLVRRLPLIGLAALLGGSLLTATAVLNGPTRLSAAGYAQVLLTDAALVYAAAVRPRRMTLPAAVVVFSGQCLAAAFYVSGEGNYVRTLLVLALAVATAWLIGDAIRARRATRSLESDRAITAERLRIARDLHDLVAHSVGVIAIQAGVGARVIDSQPAEARQALTAIELTSRETLAALRRVVSGLRNPPDAPAADDSVDPSQPGLADVERLAGAAGLAGVRLDVRWLSPGLPVPPDLDLSAYRIVQEAVTNVLRHARAQSCIVTIGSDGGELTVEVVDDGRGGAVAPGFGLTGMRERAELFNGHFTAGPRPGGGFRVAATLPLPAERP
jgi:signal transduction histidine kinase